MIIRSTTSGTMNDIVSQILQRQADKTKAQNQILSGKKLNKPSDSPVDTSKLLTLRKDQNKVNTYLDNVKTAKEHLNMVDTTLNNALEDIQTAYDLTLQASNGTNGVTQLRAIKGEIDQLKGAIIDMANTQYNNQYLYSGANTSYKPFTVEADGSVVYNGSKDNDPTSRSMEILDDVYIPLSINGEEVFGSYTAASAGPPPTPAVSKGIIGALTELSAALDLDPPDQDLVATYLKPLKEGLDNVNKVRTDFAGYNGIRITQTESYLNDMFISLEERRSDIEDIDVIEAVTNLTKSSYAYEASLAIFSKTMSTSLLNYL